MSNVLIGCKDMLVEALFDWPIGTILTVLIFVCVLLLVVLMLWGLFLAADSWFLSKNRGTGRVVDKTFEPAQTQMVPIFNVALRMTTLHPVHHSDSWLLRVEIDGKEDEIVVPQEVYDRLSLDDSLSIQYCMGRFSGDLYITEFYP